MRGSVFGRRGGGERGGNKFACGRDCESDRVRQKLDATSARQGRDSDVGAIAREALTGSFKLRVPGRRMSGSVGEVMRTRAGEPRAASRTRARRGSLRVLECSRRPAQRGFWETRWSRARRVAMRVDGNGDVVEGRILSRISAGSFKAGCEAVEDVCGFDISYTGIKKLRILCAQSAIENRNDTGRLEVREKTEERRGGSSSGDE
ncbi:hypothetical protein C8J57DRAFT_1213956 [Mycena rebaudengoi]|nr:hypothetical protein C8J57DRAFT_1213956 [Mycena rebaudengoi]